ncbi:MAG: hypothetical protein BGP12_20935 [Rhodospirillales bacterium 70-18]|nr:PAS domain S-box protein [Rhodospirillales bacterium]OJY70227.1 MAG: hypothetical protein BGP12_20935 [Rhodospirillales bacterium 70-18]
MIRTTLVDTAPAENFDRILRIATRIFEAPIALIAFANGEPAWCKASVGIASTDLPAAVEIALAGIAAGETRIVPDAWPELAEIRFHAAAPLRTPDGQPVGALCVMDRRPRQEFAAADRAMLTDLGRAVMAELELRARGLQARTLVGELDLRNAVLAAAGAAPSVGEALERIMGVTCDALGAALCHVWQQPAGEDRLRFLGGVIRGRLRHTDYLGRCRALDVYAHNSVVGEAIRTDRQIITPEIAAEDLGHHPLLRLSHENGLLSRIVTPLRVGEDCYAMLTCFDRPDADVAAAAGQVRGIALALLPVLRRQQDHARAELFQRIVETTADAVVVAGADPGDGAGDDSGPRIVYVNPAFEQVTGYTAAEVAGRSPRLLYGPRTEPAARAALRAAIVARRPLRQTITHHRKDGTPFVADLNVSPVTDSMGRHTSWVAIQRDMTAYFEAAEEVGRREAAFRRLFHSNPVPMWIYDRASLRFLEVNNAAMSVYGWTREQFLAMTILDIRPEAERTAAAGSAQAPRDGRAVSGPWRHITAGGQERLVQIMSSLLEHEGTPAVLVGVFDMTEQVRAERALRHSQASLQQTTGQLAEALRLAKLGPWRWRVGAEAAEWSDEIFAIFGTDRASFVPTVETALARIHPDDRQMTRDFLEQTATASGPRSFDFRVLRPDGRIGHCWIEGSRVEDPATGEIWLHGFCQDVTERREIEQALLRAEKLDTIGQMTGGVAHDFNNLLTVIAISLELADAAAEGNPTLRPLIRAAREATDKGAQLTAQLLSYARRQPLRPRPVAPSDFVADLLDMVPRVMGERHTLRASVAPGTPRFQADPAQLETAMLNLLLNARDAMPAGGGITLEMAPVTFTEAYAINQDEVQPGDYVMIAVADAGTGMSAETLARVFEPFFTTKPVGRGTGLGLSMVLGFAKQSGGHVSVYSEMARGTVVKLYLPVTVTEAELPAALAAPQGRLPPIEVLVVEDKEDVRAIACQLCVDLGLMPTAAASGEEALSYLQAGFRFGLLFTDVVLGGALDGVRLAEQASALQPGLPVLFTSGYTENTIVHGGRLDEGVRLLTKPYSKAQFVAAVAAALASMLA